VGSTTQSLVTNFIKMGSDVFKLQGSEYRGIPLSWLIAVLTVMLFWTYVNKCCRVLYVIMKLARPTATSVRTTRRSRRLCVTLASANAATAKLKMETAKVTLSHVRRVMVEIFDFTKSRGVYII